MGGKNWSGTGGKKPRDLTLDPFAGYQENEKYKREKERERERRERDGKIKEFFFTEATEISFITQPESIDLQSRILIRLWNCENVG